MKRFNSYCREIYETRQIGSGAVLAFAIKARKNGKRSEMHFSAADRILRKQKKLNSSDIGEGIGQVAKGLINIRRQIGALTSMVAISSSLSLSRNRSKLDK